MKSDDFFEDEAFQQEEPQERNFYEGMEPMRNTRLIVFGGSFDPIHLGHVKLAEKVLELGLGDEVLFVPAKCQPLKSNGTNAGSEHRLEMLRLALEDNPKFSYSDIEIMRDGEFSYTIDTLSIICKIFPDYKISFMIGTDSLRTLHQWRDAFKLVNRTDFIIYPRLSGPAPAFAELVEHFGNRNATKLLNSIISEENLPVWDIASSDIREACRNGGDLSGYLPEKVWQYIQEHHLYMS